MGSGLGGGEECRPGVGAQVLGGGQSQPGWGVDPEGLIVHHDQNSVYTSYRWLGQLLIVDKAVASFCERGAKDNPKNP